MDNNCMLSEEKLVRMILDERTLMGPLELAWIAYRGFSSHNLKVVGCINNAVNHDLAPIFEILLGRHLTGPDLSRVPKLIRFDGMWEYKNEHKTYVVSNKWTNRQATIAFVIMRPLCGKDVASVIARMLAYMYLDDFRWLASFKNMDTYQVGPLIRKRMTLGAVG